DLGEEVDGFQENQPAGLCDTCEARGQGITRHNPAMRQTSWPAFISLGEGVSIEDWQPALVPPSGTVIERAHDRSLGQEPGQKMGIEGQSSKGQPMGPFFAQGMTAIEGAN